MFSGLVAFPLQLETSFQLQDVFLITTDIFKGLEVIFTHWLQTRDQSGDLSILLSLLSLVSLSLLVS